MLVRKIVDQDKEGIIKLFQDVGNYFVPPLDSRTSLEGYYNYATGNNPDYIQKKYGKAFEPKLPFAFVAVDPDDNSIIGFAAGFGYFEPFDGAYFVCIMVSPNTWRKGVGTRLVNEVLTELVEQNSEKVSLTTWSTNAASLRLWQKFDFTLYKTIEDEREPGVHGMYFCKDLVAYARTLPNAIVSLA